MASKSSRSAEQNDNSKIVNLIESVKKDNLSQFGEIKKEFGGVHTRLDDHFKRIKSLEDDRIGRDAIEEYKKTNSANGSKSDNNNGTVNKELMSALKALGLVILALAAAIAAMKVTT